MTLLARQITAAVTAGAILGLAGTSDFGTADADDQRAAGVEPAVTPVGPTLIEQGPYDTAPARIIRG